MQLYTREDLLKRAWVADARQADLMIDAIAASYNGDINNFNCLINTVANLHWMAEALKCTDPDSIKTQTVLSTEEVLQVSELEFAAYVNFVAYDITINQQVGNTPVSVSFSYSTAPPNNINTVLNYFLNEINTNTLLNVTAALGTNPNTIIVTAGSGDPVFATISLQRITSVEVVDGEEINKISIEETPVNRCLTDENIQGIVLKTERITGPLCGCDPNELIDDTIPDIIKYSNENIYPIQGGPIQVVSVGVIIPPPINPLDEFNDFQIQDFNPLDFA